MTEEQKSEGEFKKQIHQILDHPELGYPKDGPKKDETLIDWLMAHRERLGTYNTLIQVEPILKMIEDAKKELLSTVHENCWWSTEAGCHAPNWFIYHQQPEDCPKRRLEKWFGK